MGKLSWIVCLGNSCSLGVLVVSLRIDDDARSASVMLQGKELGGIETLIVLNTFARFVFREYGLTFRLVRARKLAYLNI
ncbi:MAG: hypothetical protein OEY88_10325 [Candidatus Bathyarchaeota archaeon]|nr:hypothetical protein [Candidatus Bathyarchaeota archaeon]